MGAFQWCYLAMGATVVLTWTASWVTYGAPLAQVAVALLNALYWVIGENVLRTEAGKETTKEFTGDGNGIAKGRGIDTSRMVGIGHAIAYIGAPLLRMLLLNLEGDNVVKRQHQQQQCNICLALVLASCAAGFMLRSWAMSTLGKYFTRQLRLQDKQQVVSSGPYRFVRHPGYAANVLMVIPYIAEAAGHNIFAVVLAGIWLAIVVVRIRVEEQMLLQSPEIGDAYKKFCATVKYRLLPGIY